MVIPAPSVCMFAAALASAALGQTLPHGVAAGDVDQTSAVLWARSTAVGEVTFEYSVNADFVGATSVATDVSDATVPVKVDIGPLNTGTTYYYRVTDAAGDSAAGTFRTPAADGLLGLRFGVSGDWRGELRPYPSISNVPDRNLDFFVALGDTTYADVPSLDFPHPQARSLEEFRIKHAEGLSERYDINSWAEVRASTPMYVCIDDHEVTNDFAGGAPVGSDGRFDTRGSFLNETELYTNGLQAFQEYHPIRDEIYGDVGDPRMNGKPNLYRFRRFGQDAAIFLLDARSFRDEALPSVVNPFDSDGIEEFLEASYDPTRTMLGGAQLEQLKADLLASLDVTWKFILVPEPIQNLGPLLASDRFEGYAHERSELLRFIDENGIDNVVFIAADIHGTVVNNLRYQNGPDGPWISTTAFEITTGPVAYAAPLGATVVSFAPLGVLSGPFYALFGQLGRTLQNGLLQAAGDAYLRGRGYSPIGLEGSPIDVTLLEGCYISANAYGWTEFEIDSTTQRLTVTTYGIGWYSPADMQLVPNLILARTPSIVSRFRVEPKTMDGEGQVPPARSSPCGALGAINLAALATALAFSFFARPKRKR